MVVPLLCRCYGDGDLQCVDVGVGGCGGEATIAGRWSQICDQLLVVDFDRDRFVTIKFNKL